MTKWHKLTGKSLSALRTIELYHRNPYEPLDKWLREWYQHTIECVGKPPPIPTEQVDWKRVAADLAQQAAIERIRVRGGGLVDYEAELWMDSVDDWDHHVWVATAALKELVDWAEALRDEGEG